MFKRKNKEPKVNPLQDKAARKIAGFMITAQTKFADRMNKHASKVPVARMKILVILFALSWGGLSFYFIADAVFGPKHPRLTIDGIKLLRHIDQPRREAGESNVDPGTYRQIQAYKKYMDSTQQSIRPGLLDSMNLLEQIYLSQQKNEANEK